MTPVFALYDTFKVGKDQNNMVSVAGITQFNPSTTKNAQTRYRWEHKGWAVTDLIGIQKQVALTFEVLGQKPNGDPVDEGNHLLCSLENAQMDEARLFYEYVLEGLKYEGVAAFDVQIQGGDSNSILTGSGTMYLYGKPVITEVENSSATVLDPLVIGGGSNNGGSNSGGNTPANP